MSPRVDRVSIAVALCTYRRNDPLRVALRAVSACAERLHDRAAVGVVVVDDNADGGARTVADEFDGVFELGLRYCHSGARNIARARNLAISTAMTIGDWVAMTDDDNEPDPEWLAALLDTATQYGADCVTGPMVPRMPPGSPRWLVNQPFADDIALVVADGSRLDVAATNNSMIASHFLRDHPEIRFDERFGVLGGEDMVFYRTAVAAGLEVRYSNAALVWANESRARATFRHQVRYRYWLGNSEGVTNLELGQTSRARLALRAARRLGAAAARPARQVFRGAPPQIHYAVASTAGPCGMLGAALGRRVPHPQV